MQIGPYLGLGGDLFTFFGGIVLALDAANREKEFERIRSISGKALGSGALARLKIDLKGIILTDENDVERAFVRQSAANAVWGCGALALGFLLLLSARIMEIWK